MTFQYFIKTALIILISYGINAQSIGVNTSFPDPSSVMDIRSTHQGILLPRINLVDSHDDFTIQQPATGLLVYNTNPNLPNGTGYYYNIGSANAPHWKSLRTNEFTLPYAGLVSTAADAFAVKNSGSGNALMVDGKIKIINTFQSPGKVLMTSWPDGEVNWEGGIAFSANNIGLTDLTIPHNTDVKVPFYAESYDMGNNFVLNTGIVNPSNFIAPRAGLYHFDATVLWNGFSGSSSTDYGGLTIWVNGVAYLGNRQNAGGTTFSNSFGVDIVLGPGDKVYLTVYQNSISSQTINNITAANRFSGRFISTM